MPVVDLVLLGGSTWVGLDGLRLRMARVATPGRQELAEDGVGELLPLDEAGPV